MNLDRGLNRPTRYASLHLQRNRSPLAYRRGHFRGAPPEYGKPATRGHGIHPDPETVWVTDFVCSGSAKDKILPCDDPCPNFRRTTRREIAKAAFDGPSRRLFYAFRRVLQVDLRGSSHPTK